MACVGLPSDTQAFLLLDLCIETERQIERQRDTLIKILLIYFVIALFLFSVAYCHLINLPFLINNSPVFLKTGTRVVFSSQCTNVSLNSLSRLFLSLMLSQWDNNTGSSELIVLLLVVHLVNYSPTLALISLMNFERRVTNLVNLQMFIVIFQ